MESRHNHYDYSEVAQPVRETESVFEFELLDQPETRAEYVRLTDELIARLIQDKTDVAIFLDKSARPVAWLVKELWPILAPINPDTNAQFELPAIKFLNIDREQWGPVLGRSEGGMINVNNLPADAAEGLKQVYAPIAGISEEKDSSLLTDKRIMIVDEIRQSGDTLTMSKAILNKVFPDAAEINGAYWMPGKIERDPKSGGMVGKGGPVWYSDREVTGRLVGNRDTWKSLSSNSSRQRAGQYWLSTPFKGDRDVKGLQLKEEVKQLAKELATHKMLYMPSLNWDSTSIEKVADRIERIDGISFEDYVVLRRASRSGAEMVENYRRLISR